MFVFSKFSTNKLQFYKLLCYQNVGIPASQVTKLLSYKIFRVTELLVTKLNYKFFSYQKSVNPYDYKTTKLCILLTKINNLKFNCSI